MMPWRKKVEEYVELRRSLGFKLLDTNNGLIKFASLLEQSRATHITIALAMKWRSRTRMRAPPNGPGGSVSFAVLHATGAPMIPEPRCRHPGCSLTGPRGLARTSTATMRSGSYSRPRDDCRLFTAYGVRPITACWGCWLWRACGSVRSATCKQKMWI
jgi:hypothetical protein